MNRVFVSSVVAALMAAAVLPAQSRAECIEWQGDIRQGGLIWSKVSPGTRVSLAGEVLDVLPDGTVFAAFGRDALAEVRVEVSAAGGCSEALAVAQREYNISRVEGVPQRTVTPSPEHQARIKRERALVGEAKGQRLDRPDLLQAVIAGFEWPVTGRISGVYGSQRIYNGSPGNPHYGVDVARPTGTPVKAPGPGVVTLAESDLFYSGGTIILDHGYGLSSSFLHLSKIDVKVGDEINTGDVIGEIGATGRATGPHLDWRMSWRSHRVDPQLLVAPMPSGNTAE